MSEDTKQADAGAAESELPETWEEVKAEGAKEQPKATEAADAEPEGDADEDQEADGDDKGDDDRPRKKSRSERLRGQNERLKARIAELETGSAPSAGQDEAAIEGAVKARIGEPPKEADFSDWFEYQTQKTAYDLDKRQVTRQIQDGAKQAQQARGERIRELAEDYQDHLGTAAKAIPDLMETLDKSTWRPNSIVETLLLEAGEKAPLVVYHLAQNPRTAAALNAMSPIEAAREIGRIEGRVSVPKATATRAGPPLSSVKGSASPQRAIGRSMSDYERWRNS
jgi:hypothetical protein